MWPGFKSRRRRHMWLVLSLAPRGFSPGTPVFPSHQKPTVHNFKSTKNKVDEEPLSGCATSKSLFIYLLECSILRTLLSHSLSGPVAWARLWLDWGKGTLKIKKICFSLKVSIQPCRPKSDSALPWAIRTQLGQESSIKRLFQPTIGPISALGANQP